MPLQVRKRGQGGTLGAYLRFILSTSLLFKVKPDALRLPFEFPMLQDDRVLKLGIGGLCFCAIAAGLRGMLCTFRPCRSESLACNSCRSIFGIASGVINRGTSSVLY